MGPTPGGTFHWPPRACVLGNEVLLPAWALGDQPGCQPSQVWLLGRTSPHPQEAIRPDWAVSQLQWGPQAAGHRHEAPATFQGRGSQLSAEVVRWGGCLK